MKQSIALGCFIALGSAATLHAEDASFKAYGFADARLNSQWYEENNFLRQYGIVTPNNQFFLDHVNTYFDWKPNSNVRVLAEVALNPDPSQKTTPAVRTVFDSAAMYASLYSQVGSATAAGFVAYLQNTPPYSSLPSVVLQHIADSLAADTLSKTVHGIGVQTRSNVGQQATTSPKDRGIMLPRVHADLLVADELNFRVGKFITPSGIWNVDHGSPTILTVRQPYQTAFFPIFPEAQSGLQVFGKTVVADQDLSYATWVTTGRGGGDVLGSSDFGQSPKNLDDWAWGTHLQADLSYLDGIRLGGTFHTGTDRGWYDEVTLPINSIDVKTQNVLDLAEATTVYKTTSYSRELCYGLDSKIQWNKFLLQGEWNHRKVLNLLNDQAATDFNAWYVLVSKTIPVTKNLDLTPYAMYETIGWEKPENNPVLGLVGVPMEGFGTVVGGLNIGLYSQVRLKLEYSHVAIAAVNYASGTTANTLKDSDLSIDELDAQFSVAF